MSARANARFTIATYNMHKCRGLDRRVRPDRIVEVLKETGADTTSTTTRHSRQ